MSSLTETGAISEGLLSKDPRFTRMFCRSTLEVGLILGILLILAGAGAWISGLEYWRNRWFGALDPEKTLSILILGVVSFMLGFQVNISSFFFSVLGKRRR